MLLPKTEMLRSGETIDALSTSGAVEAFLRDQALAIEAVAGVAIEIEAGANAMAAAVQRGNSLIYAAAGSSGLMALADASELSGTFGIEEKIIHVHMAGGTPVNGKMAGDTEDDILAGAAVGTTIACGDVVIVLSASGTTPYAIAAAKSAKERGGIIIGLANNPATDLLDISDIAICIETPPEVIAGSTRLSAATAQKAALNLMSSLMGIKLGHVYKGFMVNVVADNAKLLNRAVGIITQITNVKMADAHDALKHANGNTKIAILVAAGCPVDKAIEALSVSDGDLNECFEILKLKQD